MTKTSQDLKEISQTAKKDMLFGVMALMLGAMLTSLSVYFSFLLIAGGMLLGGGLREAGIWK